MSSLDSWLEPLRAYPRGLVLACVVLGLAGVLWALAKIAKWALYALVAAIFILITVAAAQWLWE